jgi:HAE1 family hydrophobic/amphiphilic exporter-1
MQWLSKLSVRRPVLASVMMLTIVVVGLVGYGSLGVDKFPKIEFPVVVITTAYPGASPTSVETDITEKIEEVANTISGVETLSSITSEGASLVAVQFDLEKDGDVAAQEVRDRISTILSELPVGSRPPQVQKLDPDAAPILMLSVKGDLPVRELTRVADKVVKRRIETVLGVGQVRIIGGQERRIEVVIDPVRLRAANVTALEVQRAVAVGNVSVPGGRLEEGPTNASVRIEGRVGSPDQIGDLIVRQQGLNPIRVRDVATVLDTTEDADSAAVRDGVSSVVLAIRKQSGANTVEVVDAAKAAIAEFSAAGSLPPGVQLDIVRDNSEMVRTAASQVQEHLWLGALLAAVVVLVFLGSFRSTIIAAVSIPISLVGTFGLMSWAGFSLNLMTLLALALAVGIVIDDAIVVLENIHRFIEEKGMKPFPAAVLATKEIGMAVLATSLSLMAVFLPVAFMGGIVGRFLASFGLTMAFAILVSLIVSFTLTPMMAARMLKPPRPEGTERKKPVLERMVDRFYHPVESVYMGALKWSMKRRWVIVIICFVALFSVPTLAGIAGGGFLPDNDEAHFEIYLEAPEGSSLDATTVLAERVARDTRKVAGVTHTLLTIGDDEQKRTNIAKIYVRLSNPDQRVKDQGMIMEDVRKQVLSHVPEGVTAAAQLVNDFSLGGQNALVQYLISGPDLDRLEGFANRITAKMKKIPGVVDADNTASAPIPEATLRPDFERAAALGVNTGDVAQTLRLLIGGVETTTFEEKGDQYDVFLRASERYRTDPTALGVLTVPSSTLGIVPLSDVVTIDQTKGPSQINRVARSRQVTVMCNIAPGYSQQDVMEQVEKAIADEHLPQGYTVVPFGQAKELGRMQQAFMFAFLMSFVFMYLVLAAQFESWLHPFTIMLALPLTLPFAFASIALFGQQINIFSMLGLLVLFGVVKKNAILQIDQANQLRAQGQPRNEAILEANRHRLKPILMTTLAFVAGMLPLVFSSGIGSGFSKAMATIVVGGQSLSLLLTLLAIPVIYSLFDDAGIKLSRLARRIRGRDRVVEDRGEAELDKILHTP